MKTLAELQAIKDKVKDSMTIRDGLKATKVVVGMGTVGINAGARDVLNAFVEAVFENGLAEKVSVTMDAAVEGVEVTENGKVTVYENMTADKAKEVVKRHLLGGAVVTEYIKA